MAVAGYIVHGNADFIGQYSKELSCILLGLGVLFAGYLIYNGFFKAKKAKHQ